MRWEDERYVRLYIRDTVTWKLLPWQGRALLPLMLRKVDRAGIMDFGCDGADCDEGVAALVDLPLDVVTVGLAALIKRGTVRVDEGRLVFPNFLEAQESRASDKARQQTRRDKARDVTHRDDPSRTVTNRHPASPDVTPRHPASPRVTPSRAVPCPTVPSHTEPCDSEARARAPTREATGALDIDEALATLRATCDGKLSVAADSQSKIALRALLSDLATGGGLSRPVDLALLGVFGEWAAAGGFAWWSEGKPGVAYLLKPGVLVKHLDDAATWDADRRPAIRRKGDPDPEPENATDIMWAKGLADMKRRNEELAAAAKQRAEAANGR